MLTCTTADGVEVKAGDTVWIYNSGEIYPMEVGEVLGPYKFAYVTCQKNIEPGEEYYHASNNLYVKRHTACARNPYRPKKQKAEGQQTIGRAKNGRVLYSSKHLAG
jgi:hypothetical protein